MHSHFMRLIDTMVEDSSFIKMNAPNIEEDTKGNIASLVQFDMQRSLVADACGPCACFRPAGLQTPLLIPVSPGIMSPALPR